MPTVDPLSTSTSLINQIRAGEQTAWHLLVKIYSPLVARWARQQGIHEADIEDIAQNVFTAVSEHIATFGQDRSDNSFRGWLWTVTRSKVINHQRNLRKHLEARGGQISAGLDLPAANPVDDPTSSESTGDLQLLVASALEVIRQDFSQQTWQAFWQTAALGQRPSEVARELGMTPAAVCMCRARVLRRLRETIGEL
jgi:RNA polymerase sigma-70 factor (ECF subfamily)